MTLRELRENTKDIDGDVEFVPLIHIDGALVHPEKFQFIHKLADDGLPEALLINVELKGYFIGDRR